jgi:predicted transcriptional regulator
MSKKRYTVYLSRPLARQFDLTAQQRHGAKSALVEEALRASLQPQQHPRIEAHLLRRLDELSASLATIERDVAIVTETLALFVRYYLTITPPLPQSEQEPARLLGKERFQVFVAQVGRRLAEDHRLVSEVLETIAVNEPDLFATASDDAPLKNWASGGGHNRQPAHSEGENAGE